MGLDDRMAGWAVNNQESVYDKTILRKPMIPKFLHSPVRHGLTSSKITTRLPLPPNKP